MKRAIVSGANGFIGSAVVKYLISQGIEVIALHRKNNCDNIPESSLIKKMVMDLEKIEDIQKEIPFGKYDIFYHFAWKGSAGEARSDTKLQLQNAQWTVEALRVAHKLGCKRFICAGSIMEYEAMAACYTQGNRPGLGYIYGGGKVVAHIMCMSVAAKLGIELIWPEITNAYGVGEISPRMVNTTIRKCIKNEIPQFTAGTQNYDFVYIADVARAFYLIGKNGKPFHEYLIGSSTARPLKEFLLEMKKTIAQDLEFVFGNVPFTGTNLPIEKFDCTKTEQDTGFKAEVSFAEGIKRTMKWLKEMEN
ncbi:NAD-dependent epimerase/dehydratase family protein [Pectinatus cerevisiiphilus]|uniref:Nucleoside-diphosphate-sugar epimerase n=1 Tax=Pectinatus cerevisiiphilus TaxID=86956 RepID=A0A4R3K237_9FIRM|nr:NAD(P)-dependent oxidoreductase [Pectinatus cerevisiiphilus]TCS76024.1 nucleoside-diphosphate-sugar epimerase [Pectinatus cerevisiiphilus]